VTVLDSPIQQPAAVRRSTSQAAELRCIVCHRPFEFALGQAAIVLKHIAYGYDFTHEGVCEAAARSWICVDPDYDRPAFGSDGTRTRVLSVSTADRWMVALPNAPDVVEAGHPVSYEPLSLWALVEYRDGSRKMEGIIRSPEWGTEPGGAEFPEARLGHRASLGYVHELDAR
jgi:hypothetical protein